MIAPASRIIFLLAMSAALAACGDEDTGETVATGEAQSVTGNRAPEISGEAVQWIIEGDEFAFEPVATDPDGDALIFSVSGKPGWMDFDNQTGRLTGRPRGQDIGRHRGIVVSVSDGQDEAVLDPMDVEVLPESAGANQAPSISGTPGSEALVGRFYDFIPTVSDAEGNALTFQVVNRPSWAQFDNVIGRLSGTPDAEDVGAYVGITIRVNDGFNTSELGPFSINVNDPPMTNTAPVISGTPNSDVTAGESWSFTPQASDADGDTLVFQAFNLPSWAFFSTSTGQMSGTPDESDVGTDAGITIVVSDGEASASLPSFSVAVESANNPPSISGTPGGTAVAGELYSFTPQASDPDGDSLSFSIQNRPSWLTFSGSTGALFGTPNDGDAGSYSDIAITVSDGLSVAALAVFSIDVLAANSAPVISGSPATSALAGQAYVFTPTVSDPDGDDLSFSAGNLPAWLSIDPDSGALSGLPDAGDVGVYTGITIAASDGALSDQLGPFSISVAAMAFGSATLSWTAPSENTDGSALTDLAGFNIYWGTDPGNYSQSHTLNGTGTLTYVVDNLLAGSTYYFAVTAFNDDDIESSFSNMASKTITP